MKMQSLAIKSTDFENREKTFETFEGQHETRTLGPEIFRVFGIFKTIFLLFFLLVAVIVGSVVVPSEKTFANDLGGDRPQYQILPPPNPMEEIAMKDVFFHFNGFDIKESAKAVLDENAAVLKSNPDVIVFVEGHCSARENTDKGLGLKRAYAISDYIVKQGVEPQRVNSVDKCNQSNVSLSTDQITWGLDRKVHFIPLRTKQKVFDVAVH